MSHSIFQALSQQKIETFRSAFVGLSKELFYDSEKRQLRHSAEFGAFRERLCADFLKLFLPSYLSISSGFLINRENKTSTQCDLVIFDPQYTPLVEDADKTRFFPVETVVAIGEVKSTLSKTDLLDSLIKLSLNKGLRNGDLGSAVRKRVNEDNHHFDNMVSFLICEKFSFKLGDLTADISRHYDKHNIPLEHRHNLVLSIEDGILCYKNHLLERNVSWMYPFTRGERMKNRFVSSGENKKNHFGIFTAYVFMLCASTTVYLPEIRNYDIPPSNGEYNDEL